jgi:hypothetical protein
MQYHIELKSTNQTTLAIYLNMQAVKTPLAIYFNMQAVQLDNALSHKIKIH